MLLNSLKQQIIGTINLSLPIIALYYIYPPLIVTFWGSIVTSLVIGSYVLYLHYRIAKNSIAPLQFIPSGLHKDQFDAAIRACGIDPKTINLRYSFTNEGIAMATFNTICIDPLVWHGFDEDPAFSQAQLVIAQHITPTLPPLALTRIQTCKALLSEPAQRFLFKHELGHVVQNYSYKKLVLTGIIAATAAYSGIQTAMALSGMIAGIVGILVGCAVDLLLSYASNATFKSREEYNADLFAVMYSTKEEISAAADFFEKYQDIILTHQEPGSLVLLFPSRMLSGHYDGKSRAEYLRKKKK